MGLLARLFRRLLTKIFLVVGVVVGAALLFKAQEDGDRIARRMKSETGRAAHQLGQLVVTSIEHSMEQGEGIAVEILVDDIKKRVPEADIHIYDPRGIEVFARAPLPGPGELPDDVTATLADGRRRTRGDRVVREVAHEQRCEQCHDPPGKRRGALALEVDPAACAERRDQVITDLVDEGFVHVMTARQAKLLDDYFREITEKAPAVRAAAVFDADGDVAFSSPNAAVDPAAVRDALVPGAGPRRLAGDGGTVSLVPLVMGERCVGCHKDPRGKVRGVLALALAPPAGGGCDVPALEALIDTSLRYVMLSALGRRIADFLDAAVATGALRELVLYDNQGRRFWTTTHPRPPPHVATVLAGGEVPAELIGSGMDEQLRVVEPLRNKKGCARCHGDTGALRGVVSVGLSTAEAAHMRADQRRAASLFTGTILAAIVLILAALLQFLVVRPLSRIGDAADSIGQGDLTVAVQPSRSDGDEVARLGARINQMVVGLRAKTALEKMVSRGAAAAAEAAAATRASAVHSSSERRHVAVLFSDIRGFTSYSEEHEPEQVVSMLNELLDVQAGVVDAHDGDIDKFVGDALVAVFHGDGAERRALACAVELVDAVDRVGREGLVVGVGVNAGEVIYGAVGAELRIDFTVIGDVVNTAARLCSAAGGGQVLVTTAVRERAGAIDGIELTEAEPLQVKGKKAPLAVFRARRG